MRDERREAKDEWLKGLGCFKTSLGYVIPSETRNPGL